MGVLCQFFVSQSQQNEFTSGSVVCGTIKFVFDEETVVKKITVSFKGYGRLHVIENEEFALSDKICENNTEDYFNFMNIAFQDETGTVFPAGEYETAFRYIIPENVPSSLNFYKNNYNHQIFCKIAYNLRVDFDIPGFITNEKTCFEKEINVVSSLTPRLPIQPTVYGKRKTLFRLLSKNKDIIHLKACIKNSIIKPGDKVKLAYEVVNDSDTAVQAIEAKLVEICSLYNNKQEVLKVFAADVEGTESKTSLIKSGETVEAALEISVPQELSSITSKIVSREYAIVISARIPMPYAKLSLKIPVQIGIPVLRIIPENEYSNMDLLHTEPPPVYEYFASTNESIEILRSSDEHL